MQKEIAGPEDGDTVARMRIELLHSLTSVFMAMDGKTQKEATAGNVWAVSHGRCSRIRLIFENRSDIHDIDMMLDCVYSTERTK